MNVLIGYGLFNLGTALKWDIRSNPFTGWIEDQNIVNCANIGDGANLAFTAMVLGWLYSLIYTGWWEMIWDTYHKRKTRLLDEKFRRDWLSWIAVGFSVVIPVLFAVLALWDLLRKATG